MQLLGIVVNLDHKWAICTICHSAVAPEKLYDHTRKSGHHNTKDFGKGQRLAFATRKFCEQFVAQHHLSNPQRPNAIIPAIPGLEVRTEMMMICGGCGYAVQTKASLRKHQLSTCPESSSLKGPAQTLYPTTHSGGSFGVQLPPHSDPNPLDVATLFREQFASVDPYADTPIRAATHPREMKIFLDTENWLDEVDGMTGRQITKLARGARSELRAMVKKIISDYTSTMVEKLRGIEHSVRVAVGDYNK